jgi:plasmid stabilization system protein ParE
MYLLKIRFLAKDDIQQIVDYYEEKAPFVVDKFLEQLYIELEHIQQNPKLFQVKYKNTRVSYLKNFPFGIHYILDETKIEILGVFHTERNPKIWKKR